MPAGRIVAIDGPSASGKTELVRRLGMILGWTPLDEAYRLGTALSLRYRTPAELALLEHRLIRREVARWKRAVRLASSGEDVILDTGPWGPWTYTTGLVVAGFAPKWVLARVRAEFFRLERGGQIGWPHRTFYLDVPVRERDRRARLDRRGHPARLYERHARVAPTERSLASGAWGRRRGIRRIRVGAGESPEALARRLVPRLNAVPRPPRRERSRPSDVTRRRRPAARQR